MPATTTLSVSPQEAARELLRRRRARASLTGFANAVNIPGKPAEEDPTGWLFEPVETTLAAHHLLLLDHLEKVARGEIQRLMVFMPPGSAKSTYTSVVFPAWYMGWRPGSKIILASYASDIARKQGRRARQIVRSPGYVPIFGATISDESSAADQWSLSNGSEFMAGGILSGLTGNRGHGIIIDDPVAGREEADSETIQKKTLEAYQDDLRTRLIPGGFEIIVQTRWNKKDLAGRILPERWAGESGPIGCRDGKVWHVICLPAIAERADDPLGRSIGERLWKEWFTADHFETFRKQGRTWSALFQQRPTDPEGGYFKREWFKVIEADRVPQLTKVVRCWDLAATAEGENGNDDPDWLAGVKMGRTADGRYYILHVHRARVSAKVVEDRIKQYAMTDGRDVAIRIEQEGAASGKIVKSHFERMLDGFDARFTGIPRNSKLTRSGPFNAACERGDVFLVQSAAWNEDFIEELIAFPLGPHDDQGDGASGAYAFLTDESKPWDLDAFKSVRGRSIPHDPFAAAGHRR
ncbi:MAG TPA: phage terminase large subunit [Tepidisphaeraceae bacterium]|nr:phage terminase large subunit [Tepidisphaeraceae bacterium]